MAVKKRRGTGRLHWPGTGHEHDGDEAERLRPLEEIEAFKDSAQRDGDRAAKDTIRVDSTSVRMPDNLVGEEREGGTIFRLEPVVVFLLVGMLAFIAFIAWQITLMPAK